MERKDLLLENAKIFSAQGKALDAVASRDVRVLVVGNPANTNSLIAQRNAPSLPRNRFTAMTRLDHNRGLAQLTEKTGAPLTERQESHHLGQSLGNSVSGSAPRHRRRQAGALVGGSKLVQGQLYSHRAAARRGRDQGARHLLRRIGRRGGDRSCARLDARHATRTTGSAWAVPSDGSYGIPEGVIYSYPVTCKNGEYSIVQGLAINDFSREKMQATHRELLEERDGVKDLI